MGYSDSVRIWKVKKKKMGGRDEEEDSNLNAEKIPENKREVVKILKEIVKYSEQEIYAMLVECNMDVNEAITCLLSQDSFQKVKSKRNKKKETKKRSDIQRVASSNQNHGYKNGGDYYVGQDDGNKFNTDEMSNVQGSRNHLADSSTTPSILGRHPSLNSDVSNVKTERVPIISGEAVSSLSVPPSLGCGTSCHRTMADVEKMGLGSLKESVTKAPLSADCLLSENPVVPKPLPDSFIESSAKRDQLQKSASVSNQNIQEGNDGVSQLLCDTYNNKNDETYQEQRRSSEHNQTKYPLAAVNVDQCIEGLSHLRFGTFGSGMNGPGESSGLPSQFLNDESEDISDSADDLSLSYLLRDGECHEAEEIQLRTNVANEQMAHQINSDAASKYNSSPNYDQTEPTQDNQYKSSAATEFTFDNSQLFNTVMAPSERSLQMQNFNTFPHAMHQQAFTREPDPRYSASLLDRSMPTATVPGRRLSFPMAKPSLRIGSINELPMNNLAMNHHHYSQPNVPTGHYGNMMNNSYSLPTQNEAYHMPPLSGFQQHNGSNNNGSILHSLVAPLPQNRTGDLHQPAVAAVPSARSSPYGSTYRSAYGSTNGSTNGSAYGSTNGIGMLSDNTANSRYECEEDYHSRLNKLFASLWRQNVNTNVLAPQGHNDSGSNSYSLHTGHQNQQFPSFRYSQQEQAQEQRNRGIGYEELERSRRYYASLEQQNFRRDPSNQTQQQSWPRNNY